MARYHYWGNLLNEEGQPIENADISIYLAGTTTAALIYTDEFSDESTSTAPQIFSNTNGYFEFWLPDLTSSDAYSTTQKFKIEWNKTGIEYGYIDYIDVYPASLPVNENDSTNTTKDKSVSNSLAYDWEAHRVDNSFNVHGIESVNEDDTTTVKNKLVSNNLAYDWEKHKSLTFETSGVSGATYITGTEATSADYPHGIKPIDLSEGLISTDTEYWNRNRTISFHYAKKWNDVAELGIEEVNQSDTNVTKNKLVSNYIINDLYNQIDAIDDINVRTISSATASLSATDYILHVNYTTTSTVQITLTTDNTTRGKMIIIKDASGNAGSNNITIDTEGGQLIDGSATYVMNVNYQSLKLYCDGLNWFVI